MQRLTGPLFSVLCLAALAGSATAETTLRFAHTQPTADTHHAAALHFKERVEALTNGEVKVSVHPAGELACRCFALLGGEENLVHPEVIFTFSAQRDVQGVEHR